MMKKLERKYISDNSPWKSPPHPTTFLPDKTRNHVPDASLLHNDQVTPFTKSSASTGKSNEMEKSGYQHDSRLKFYQVLESHSNRNKKLFGDSPDTVKKYCALRNFVPALERKNNLISTASERNFPGRDVDISYKNSCCRQSRLEKEISMPKTPNKGAESSLNVMNSSNYSIEKLIALIEQQNEQLKLLKMQMNDIVSNLNKRDILTHSSKDNSEGLKSIQMQSSPQRNEQLKTIRTDKVSIGVMTSLEFTIQKELNSPGIEESSRKNPAPVEEISEKNSNQNPVQKLIEKSTYHISQQISNQAVQTDERQQNISVEKHNCRVNNSIGESIKVTSTKVGWTFYNNVLCQVNEILHNSREAHRSQAECDIMEEPNNEQFEVVESAVEDIANEISSNIGDRVVEIDSSFYPRVHYENNIVQTSSSIIEANASLHMKALALKYLGNEYGNRGNISQFRKSLDDSMKSRQMLDFILRNISISAKNYMDRDQLMNHNGNFNFEKQNVLDVSILKRQPKLL